MGLFDLFSGKDDAEEAAAKNAALYQQYGQQAGNIYGTYGTQAGGALSGALDQSVGALGSGLTNQIDALRTGTTGALDAGRAGVGAYAPLSALGDRYGTAVNSYYDALGLNGPGGVTRAQSQFQTGPGYQFAVDEGTRAATNAASKLGIAGSGNTLDAIRGRAQGFADQNYNSYLDRLGSFVNPQLQATAGAASGIAGANKTLADIYSQGYGGIGNAYGANAGALAGLYTNYGQNQSNVFGNVAQGQAGALRDVTSGTAQGNTNVAQAGQQDSANFWNLLGNLGGAATKAFAPKPA
jgi:hypothetical protein